MVNKIHLRNQEQLVQTKMFLNQYLAQKNKSQEQQCYLSLYLSSDDEKTTKSRQLRLLKLFKEVELSLKSQLSPKVANNILSQLKNLNLEEIIKSNKMSLAIFATENFAGFVFVPFSVYENVVVAHSLHLKPILPWIMSEDQYYLITLSTKQCRLLKGDSFALTEIKSVSLKETEVEKYKRDHKILKSKIILKAEEVFYQIVKNDKLPIIVGGVEELHSLFESANRDPDIVSEKIIGNLDKVNFEDLHDECLGILNSIKRQKDNDLVLSYRELKPYGKIIDQIKEISVAAVQGRVRNLMIASDRFFWGHLDKKTGEITNHINKNLAIPEDDILDDLAEVVIARGGSVTLFKYSEMPTDNEAIAYLR